MKCLMLYIVFCSVQFSATSVPASDIKQLYRDLLSDYDRRVRPVYDQNKTINIWAEMEPSHIIEVDTTLQRYTFTGHFEFSWIDEFLQWNLSASHGIDEMRFLLKEIWHPTFTMSVSYYGALVIGALDETVSISNSGEVVWTTYGSFTLVFSVDMSFFPFDTQECMLNLFTKDVTQKESMQVSEGVLNPREIQSSPEWYLLDTHAGRAKAKASEQNVLRYRFLFRRKPSFVMYTTIGPLIILAILNCFVFLVPIESGEKGSIAITLLLSFCVYISSMSTLLPHNSDHKSYLLMFMTILEVNSAIVLLCTMLQSRLRAKEYSPFATCARLLTCLRGRSPNVVSADVEPEGEETLKHDSHLADGNNDSVDKTAIQTHMYIRADTIMFSISMLINVVASIVLGSKVSSSFRNTLE